MKYVCMSNNRASNDGSGRNLRAGSERLGDRVRDAKVAVGDAHVLDDVALVQNVVARRAHLHLHQPLVLSKHTHTHTSFYRTRIYFILYSYVNMKRKSGRGEQQSRRMRRAQLHTWGIGEASRHMRASSSHTSLALSFRPRNWFACDTLSVVVRYSSV